MDKQKEIFAPDLSYKISTHRTNCVAKHSITFYNTTILHGKSNYNKMLIKQSLEIPKYSNNFNEDNYSLPFDKINKY